MGAGIEWTVGVLRGGKNYKKWGDPFDYACTVLVVDSVAHFIGFDKETDILVKIPKEDRDQIRIDLLMHNATKMKRSRLKNGELISKEIDL